MTDGIVCEHCDRTATWRVVGTFGKPHKAPLIHFVCTGHVGYVIDQLPYRTATVRGIPYESPL